MRMPRLAATAASCALLVACAALTTTADAPVKHIAPASVASDYVEVVRAYDYGPSIVLEFTNPPNSLSVTDENGVPVEFEREGRYFRLARKLYDFTVHTKLGSTVFHLARPAQSVAAAPNSPVVPALPAPAALPAVPQTDRSTPEQPADADVAALVKTAASQLEEVRQAIKHGARDTHDLQALNRKLDNVEAQLAIASAAVLMVHFDSYKTTFRPSPELSRVLVSAAKAADQINLRGRTDSVVAGPLDPKIAQARALSARHFLVSHGIEPSKIHVFSLAAGDFIAPRHTPEGRALNRRVMIEIVNSRIAALARQNRDLAQDGGNDSTR